MELKNIIEKSCVETMGMFGLNVELKKSYKEKTLNSAQEINIQIGITNNIKGNIIIGLSKDMALKIVSLMMGGMGVNEFNEMGESAICEFANMLAGSVAMKLDSKYAIDISPPTLAMGKNIYLMISIIESDKLVFRIKEDSFYISYCIENHI